MDSSGGDASRILAEIEELKLEKSELGHRISVLQARFVELNEVGKEEENTCSYHCPALISGADFGHGLSTDMIYRYSRHPPLSSFGVQSVGQSSLLSSSFLVVGAGGLGAPALLYPAACGVGRLGFVDHDVVELNNLHRKIIHTEAFIGQSKVESAAAACRTINSTVQIEEHKEALQTSNALEMVSNLSYQVLDCDSKGSSLFTITMAVHAIDAYFRRHQLQQHVKVVQTMEF